MKMSLTELVAITRKAIRHYGYTEKETDVILDVLLYAQLNGKNQGVVKLIGKGIPKQPAGDIVIDKETKLSARINGNRNMGMLVMKEATKIALTKAQEHGFGIVGTYNTNTSTGSIGYYAREIAKHGFIGFVFSGSPETISPHGSYQPLFGTNPMAIGVPTDDEPMVLDMATAAIPWYGLVEAKTAGKKIDPSIVYDKEGNPTDDPAKAMDGAIRPFDKSYKSSGLALMIEVLTGPLVGAAFCGIGNADNWGNLVLVIDPNLVGADDFAHRVSELVTKVKNAKKLPGVTEIYLPGEKGRKLSKRRIAADEIDIEDHLYKELLAVSNS